MELLRLHSDGGCGPMILKRIEEEAKILKDSGQKETAEKLRKAANILKQEQEKVSKDCHKLREEVKRILVQACSSQGPSSLLSRHERNEIADFKAGRLVGGFTEFLGLYVPDKFNPPGKPISNIRRWVAREQFSTCVEQKGNQTDLLGRDLRDHIINRITAIQKGTLFPRTSHKSGTRGK